VGGGAPRVVGLIDAIVAPAWERLDFSHTDAAAMGYDTYAKTMDGLATTVINRDAVGDQSCVAYHTPLGTTSWCNDESHVVRHHITTPFFVRMALLDNLISGNYEDSKLEDPELGPFVRNAMGVPVVFATVLQRELAAFPDMRNTAEEKEAMTVNPGVFAPACANHDTIHENTEVFGVTITPPGGSPLLLFDVFEAWRSGGSPTAVTTTDPMRHDTVCP
jgi:hypothetical protein